MATLTSALHHPVLAALVDPLAVADALRSAAASPARAPLPGVLFEEVGRLVQVLRLRLADAPPPPEVAPDAPGVPPAAGTLSAGVP